MAALALPRVALAQQIATVIQVTGNAQLSLDGRRFIFRNGARIEQGSTIATGANSTVELTFDDGMNMVVGRNSALEITEILMTSGNRSDRFAVNAAAGSFRFISGNSNKGAYEITTPTATIGVRGTEFDLAVARSNTALALFDGEVQMCRGGGNCFAIRGSCAVARTQGLRRVAGVDGRDAAQLLETAFPLVGRQDRLRSPFPVNTRSCDRYNEIPRERTPVPPVQEPPAPEPPAPPPPPPEPEPEGPSFPGNSGDEGPSQGEGGGVSGGQNGTGTGSGSGQGATNGNHGGNGNGKT